ncbi:MAG: hypothetical protein JW751_08960 [Polyangiaceae bacterium]|nr:hypothetical protein [Polyangiaceae bacterium]
MNKTWMVAIGAAFLGWGCAARPAAMDVCHQLEAAGVAADCKEGKPTGVYSAAKGVADFEVVGLTGQKGHVLTFGQTGTYDNTVRSYTELGSRSADHRSGNRKRLVFATLPEHAKVEVAEKMEKVITEL